MSENLANKRVVRNSILLYVRMVFVMILSLYTTRVVLCTLGVVDYGIYNVVAGFVALFAVINKCLTTGTNRYYNFAIGKNDEEEVRRVFNSSIRIQFLLLIILVIGAELIGNWYIDNKMVIPSERLFSAKIVFHCSLASLAFLMLQIPYSAAVMAYERMDYYAIVSIIDALAKLAIVFLIRSISYDQLITYGLLMMGINIMNFTLYYLYCRYNFPSLTYSKRADKAMTKSLLSFSGWSTLDPFSYIVRDQGSNMTLNLFFGPVVNAAYGVALNISGAVTSFASNLSIAFRPQIIQSYSAGEYQRAKKLMLSMSKINYMLQVLIALPLIFEMDYVLNIWLGEGFPMYTRIFAVWVVIINCINTLNEPISIIMVATGKIKKIKSISMFIICSVVPIGYFLFKIGCPPYYIYITMFVLTLVNQYSCVIIMTKEFPIIRPVEYLRAIISPCVTFTATSLIVPLLIVSFWETSFFRLVLTVLLSMITIVIVGYYLLLAPTERVIMKNIGNRLLYKLHVK